MVQPLPGSGEWELEVKGMLNARKWIVNAECVRAHSNVTIISCSMYSCMHVQCSRVERDKERWGKGKEVNGSGEEKGRREGEGGAKLLT